MNHPLLHILQDNFLSTGKTISLQLTATEVHSAIIGIISNLSRIGYDTLTAGLSYETGLL